MTDLPLLPAKIISGGQTGADRAGLDAAIELHVPHGGFCPKGRLAEDGHVPQHYLVVETTQGTYPPRTRLNISSSDATIIFTVGELDGGSKLTKDLASDLGKPWFHINLGFEQMADVERQIELLRLWLAGLYLRLGMRPIINIAGNRESKSPGIERRVKEFLCKTFEGCT